MLILWTMVASADPVEWRSCIGSNATEMECGLLQVPDDHGNELAPGTVSLRIARHLAPGSAIASLWFVDNRLGGSSVAHLEDIEVWAAELPDVNLYALDHRGVGDVSALRCPLQESESSPGSSTITLDEIGPCGEVLQDSSDWELLDVTQSAADLMYAIEEVNDEKLPAFLIGSGYGGYLLQRSHVVSGRGAGLILDTPWSVFASLVAIDEELDAGAQFVLERCADDAECSMHLDERPVSFAYSVVDDLADGRCEGFSDTRARQILAALLHRGTPYTEALPAVISRLGRCRPDDIDALEHLAALVEVPSAGSTPALALTVTYDELFDGPKSTAPPGLAWSGDAERLAAGESQWPLAVGDTNDSRFTNRSTPALVLAAGDDLLGYDDDERALMWADAPDQVVTAPERFGPLADTACGRSVIAAFIRAPEQPVDATCVSTLRHDFAGDPELDLLLFGTDQRWAESRCGCQTASGGWASGLLLGILGLWRRRPVSRRSARTRSPGCQ